jgi:hypothetical protein
MTDRKKEYVRIVGKEVPIIGDPTKPTNPTTHPTTHSDEEATQPATHPDEEATHPTTHPDEEATHPTTKPVTAPRPPWPKNRRNDLAEDTLQGILSGGPPQSRTATGKFRDVNINAEVSLTELPQIEEIT